MSCSRFNYYSPFEFPSVITDDSTKKESAYIKSNSSGNGSYEHDQSNHGSYEHDQSIHYTPSGTAGLYQTYASSQRAQLYTPISSYRPGYDLSPNMYPNMAQGLRLDDTSISMPYKVPQFTPPSLFRAPRGRGNEFLSGMDEIREWKCEETSEKKLQLHRARDDAPIATWDSEAETAENCPMDDTRCSDHETSYNPMSKSLQELLTAVTKTSHNNPPEPATRPPRRPKRKAKDVFNGLVMDIPDVPDEKREKRSYDCRVCHRVFPTLTNLTNHFRTHKKSKRIECEVCQKTYSTKSTLAVHMRIHTGETPYHCTVTECKKQFRNSATFTRHRHTHTGEIPYKCLVCGAGFTQTGNRKRHVVKYHPYEF